ncbi:hypothetical protein RUM44_013240 [Polyplax serrata]|uniref:Transketolase-like pyrimidine-binding domain-containing protein n=1 Tax=Polyplax serrata TaxID=468196 RepID=A0ABR1BIA1_POLSC
MNFPTQMNAMRKNILHNIGFRGYQTRVGVFGYIPKSRERYKIPNEVLQLRSKNCNFTRLVAAYRKYGHLKAKINPVALAKIEDIPELEPSYYSLELQQRVPYKGILNVVNEADGTIESAISFLEKTYCHNIGYEISYLPTEEYEWLSKKIETMEPLPEKQEIILMEGMLKSQIFDQFLATKFSTLKRYGGEGAESMIAIFQQLLDYCQNNAISDIVLGMPHRGRLNLLTGLLQQSPALIFRKIKGLPEFPTSVKATGDVLSHLTCSVDIGTVHVTMLPNPSHLEAVNPVSQGKTRGKQLMAKEGDYGNKGSHLGENIINVQVHGDAAFAAQGINQEALLLSGIPHYTVGGSLHIIVNNQLGFTTPSDRGRSTTYTSDLAKTISAPVFHVNGDFPEYVAQATEIAMEYQRKFRKDVFIDLNCYRQWGHNELDDPTFTNPAIYKIIHSRKTVPDAYCDKMVNKNAVTSDRIVNIKKEYYDMLNAELKNNDYVPEEMFFKKQWSGMSQGGRNMTTWDTGMDPNILRYIGIKSVEFPKEFNIHQHLLKTHIEGRLKKMKSPNSKLDWATAESLAFGSLLYQGFNVRISGQDVGRGTFSHRHVMLVDQETNEIHIPLNNLIEDQKGMIEVANSPLSEEAVLGFEYGMSIENPNNLIIWEAQFGDFFNGAQIIIDTFVTSGETKWMKCSGMVMLLPHGYDGAGPEHSSSRIERFLQLTDSKETEADGDDVNIQIVFPSTPAQYFHLLRRQMLRNYRKPLIVISPKTLLRLSEATSSFDELDVNTNFQNVISDNTIETSRVKKVIFTTGKHYYNLIKHRSEKNVTDTAIVRVESLCPFPTNELQKEVDKFIHANEFVWCQEEPRNMGAWTFVKPRFENLVGVGLTYVGPSEIATPALVGQEHYRSHNKIFEDVFGKV